MHIGKEGLFVTSKYTISIEVTEFRVSFINRQFAMDQHSLTKICPARFLSQIALP